MLEMIYFERSCYVSVNILLLYFLLSWHVASECDTHVYHILLFRRHFPFSATYTTLNFTWAWRPTTAITNGNGKTTNTSMLPGLKDRAQMGSPGRDCPHGGPYIMQQAWQEFLHFSPLISLTHVSMNQHTIIGVYRSSRRVGRDQLRTCEQSFALTQPSKVASRQSQRNLLFAHLQLSQLLAPAFMATRRILELNHLP